MINAVIYARYSPGSNQRDKSIEDQVRECREYAAAHGMNIIGIYADRRITGKTDERPEFQRMVKESARGKFQAVIMYTLDRFARTRYYSAIYKHQLKKNGVKIYYAKQEIPDGPEGIILESVLEGWAEYYSEELSRKVRRGHEGNALKSKSNGGTVPLGYRIGKDGKYEIDPVGAKAISIIFDMYDTDHSAQDIIKVLNERGFKTARGREFGKNSLYSILRNPKYIGSYTYDGMVNPNTMPAIIDKAQFNRVQQRLGIVAKAKAHYKSAVSFLLTTKAFCGECGAPLIGESGTSHTGTIHYYYKCATRKKSSKSCRKAIEKKDWLEEAVVRETIAKVLTDETIEQIADKVVEIYEKECNDQSFLRELQGRLKETERSISNLLTAIEQGIITETTKSRMLDLEAQKSDLLSQIAVEEISKPTIEKNRIVFWLISFKNGDINSTEFRSQIINTLVNRVDVYDLGDGGKKITIYYNISGENCSTISSSDITAYGAPNSENPNWFFLPRLNVFGFSFYIPAC